MYINKVILKNIRSIKDFEMTFPDGEQAGWHVLIGENGSGKSTILRSIALCLFGPEYAPAIKPNWDTWLSNKTELGNIQLVIVNKNRENKSDNKDAFPINWQFIRYKEYVGISVYQEKPEEISLQINEMHFSGKGWFSAGFGPFRRFTGGSGQWDDIYNNRRLSRIAAHLSLFNESVALTEATEWLKLLKFRSLERESSFIDDVIKLINASDFLPGNVKLTDVTSDGVFFKDSNNAKISVDQLSDGYRSILSLTFELIRQLSNFYSTNNLIKQHDAGYWYIDKPGVVLVDEIDAHLHPTWQTRIGQWFTKYFPKIQFIVTTHSPLVCRACEKGSIWRLSSPGTNYLSAQVTGTDKSRLVYGDILDAFGTEVFGKNVTQSETGIELGEEMAALSLKSFKGTITEKEKKKLNELKSIMPTV